MFGTLVEVEGGGERRWGYVRGARRPMRGVVGVNLNGFSGHALRGFGQDENPTWTFDAEGNVTMGDTPNTTDTTTSTGTDTLDAILKTVSATVPGLATLVTAAINRGVNIGTGNNCPAGYAYYSPIVKRCFQSPQEMSNAEQLFSQAQGAGGGGMNTALLIGAGVLGLGALFFFMKK